MKPYVYQRKSDGRFVGIIELKSIKGGKRNKITKYGKTEDEVWEKLNEIAFEIQTNQYVAPTKDTLIGFLKEYHGICAGYNAWGTKFIRPDKAKWEETTAALFKMYIDVHFEPYFKDMKLIEIKPMVLDKFYNHRLTENREHVVLAKGKPMKKSVPPLSINTVIKLNKFLKAAFNYAVINGIIKKNPTIGVKLGSKEDYKPTVYNEKQFISLLDHVRNTDDEIPIVLGAGCGFRRGEIFGLRWKDIDFKNSTITIEKTAVRFDKNINKDRAKNKSSQRTIAVSEHVMAVLEQYKKRVGKPGPNDKVVTRWKPGSYSERFCNLLNDFGMPHTRLHDLRHYNATLMMYGGIADKVAAERLGHSNVATLRNIYQHVFKDMDEAAAKKINEAFKTKAAEPEKPLSKEERKAKFKVI
jgi:integrase